MSRQILFRGKRVDNGEWVEGDYIASDFISPWHNGELYVNKGYYDGMEWGEGSFYRIYPNTVGQYTGLTDKNGKRIFEGDIVNTQYGRKCLVNWFQSPSYCGWDLTPINAVGKPPQRSSIWFKENIEIIGNIHENKEFDAQNGEEKEE